MRCENSGEWKDFKRIFPLKKKIEERFVKSECFR